MQPHAEAFGKACDIDPAFILNFGEEVVRGQPVFVLSGLLQDLEKSLRAAAGAGPWQVRRGGEERVLLLICCLWDDPCICGKPMGEGGWGEGGGARRGGVFMH
jgi:hypothetical protein